MCRICILAGDISPIDVITHIPVLCEENQIPYIYVPSKEVRSVQFLTADLLAALCTISKSTSSTHSLETQAATSAGPGCLASITMLCCLAMADLYHVSGTSCSAKGR